MTWLSGVGVTSPQKFAYKLQGIAKGAEPP